MRRRALALAAVTGVSALITGCSFSFSIGGDPTVSSAELENRIERSYRDQAELDLETIACESTPAEVGAEIHCVATDEARSDLVIKGEVTSVDDGNDQVAFDWDLVSVRVLGAEYARAAKRLIEARSGNPVVSVDCPERVDLEPGGEFRCGVTTPDGSRHGATMTLTDLDGGFNVRVDSTATGPDEKTGV